MASQSTDPRTQQSSLNVVIIGGSLSGLLHAITLLRHGHNVRILEQHLGPPQSHMAGISIGAQVDELLAKHDRCSDKPFALPSECLQYMDARGRVKAFYTTPRFMTSWDVLSYRLRANFDGLRSEYYPEPPRTERVGVGKAVYDEGKQVKDMVLVDGVVSVYFDDLTTGEPGKVEADLVIGADGPNSVVREKFLPPSAIQRLYAGYVVWRGVVPEREVSDETRRIFEKNVTYFVMQGEHALVYEIPGEKGSVNPGGRLLKFAWYSNQSLESLAEIMTDRDGHRHHDIVPSGQISDAVWEKQCLHGHKVLAAPYRELISKISGPFVQKITDSSSRQASFLDGKVLLVGDALAHFRPHIAFSTNQAAFDCLQLERYLNGEISMSEWESQVLRFGNLHWLRSIWWGDYFQRRAPFAFPSALWYWMAAATQAVRDSLGRRF